MQAQSRLHSIRWIVPLFLLFSFLICMIGGALNGGGIGMGKSRPQSTANAAVGDASDGKATLTCVVIDAGHGGEDGGASSAAGLTEKDVNLAVALYLRDILEAAGIPTVMTRTEDKLLYDRSVDFQGRKKVLDLAARRTIADETPGCLFVSIHMNAFPEAQYSGMQVWYGTQDARSADIAGGIQQGALTLMPDNHRKIKAAGSNIYLLDRITSPAVLVECGFLSNPAEAERLGDEAYRQALAMVIAGAILPFMQGGSV